MTTEQKKRSAAARAERISAQARRYAAQARNIETARMALEALVKSGDATTSQLLKGLELVVQLSENNRF